MDMTNRYSELRESRSPIELLKFNTQQSISGSAEFSNSPLQMNKKKFSVKLMNRSKSRNYESQRMTKLRSLKETLNTFSSPRLEDPKSVEFNMKQPLTPTSMKKYQQTNEYVRTEQSTHSGRLLSQSNQYPAAPFSPFSRNSLLNRDSMTPAKNHIVQTPPNDVGSTQASQKLAKLDRFRNDYKLNLTAQGEDRKYRKKEIRNMEMQKDRLMNRKLHFGTAQK